MKLEKRFYAEGNKLFYMEEKTELPPAAERLSAPGSVKSFAADGSLPADLSRLLLLELPWTQVGCDESSYNEEFLASFRDFLKALEDKGGYAAVIPVADTWPAADGGAGTAAGETAAAEKEALTASFKHCARRIKDCASVVGFAVPACLSGADADFFMEELSAKHAQYVFFTADPALLQNPALVRLPA